MVTVELIDDNGVLNIFHSHIFEPNGANISRTSLYHMHRQSFPLFLVKVSTNMVVKDVILTCQVLILTPFVVSLRKAVSNTTFVTIPVELSFPKLPMLRNTNKKRKEFLRH